jgi:hypothetical protein
VYLFQFLWHVCDRQHQFASPCLSLESYVTTRELLNKFSYEFGGSHGCEYQDNDVLGCETM